MPGTKKNCRIVCGSSGGREGDSSLEEFAHDPDQEAGAADPDQDAPVKAPEKPAAFIQRQIRSDDIVQDEGADKAGRRGFHSKTPAQVFPGKDQQRDIDGECHGPHGQPGQVIQHQGDADSTAGSDIGGCNKAGRTDTVDQCSQQQKQNVSDFFIFR